MTLRTTLALAGALVAASFAIPALADQHGTQNNTEKTSTTTSKGVHDTHATTTGNSIGTQSSTTTNTDTTSSDEKATSKNDHTTPDHADDHTGQGETKATKVPASPH
ncbi:MAG: hypothetical protein U1E87_03570 [Alphaproteobacteria bacterium]